MWRNTSPGNWEISWHSKYVFSHSHSLIHSISPSFFSFRYLCERNLLIIFDWIFIHRSKRVGRNDWHQIQATTWEPWQSRLLYGQEPHQQVTHSHSHSHSSLTLLALSHTHTHTHTLNTLNTLNTHTQMQAFFFALSHSFVTFICWLFVVFQRRLEEFYATKIHQIEEAKFRCEICHKLFRGAEFVKKHLHNKHPKEIEDIKQRVRCANRTRFPSSPSLLLIDCVHSFIHPFYFDSHFLTTDSLCVCVCVCVWRLWKNNTIKTIWMIRRESFPVIFYRHSLLDNSLLHGMYSLHFVS
jgi:hypothetical protein